MLYKIKNDFKGDFLYIKSDALITLDNKINLLESFKDSKSLPRNLRVLDSAVNSKLSFKISGVKELIKKANEAAKNYDSIKYAIVLNNPLYVAYVIFAETISANSKFSNKVFSTLKAAKIWLEK